MVAFRRTPGSVELTPSTTAGTGASTPVRMVSRAQAPTTVTPPLIGNVPACVPLESATASPTPRDVQLTDESEENGEAAEPSPGLAAAAST